MDFGPVPPLRLARERTPVAPVGPLVPFSLTGPLVNNPDFRVTLSDPARVANAPRLWYQRPPVGSIESPLTMEVKLPKPIEKREYGPFTPAGDAPARPRPQKKSPLARTFPAQRAIQSILDLF